MYTVILVVLFIYIIIFICDKISRNIYLRNIPDKSVLCEDPKYSVGDLLYNRVSERVEMVEDVLTDSQNYKYYVITFSDITPDLEGPILEEYECYRSFCYTIDNDIRISKV